MAELLAQLHPMIVHFPIALFLVGISLFFK